MNVNKVNKLVEEERRRVRFECSRSASAFGIRRKVAA